MSLTTDGSIGHGTGSKAFDNIFDRFNLVQSYGMPFLELKKSPQGIQPPGPIVDNPRILLERIEILISYSLVQGNDRFGAE